MHQYRNFLFKALRTLVGISGVIFLVLLVFSFTRIPFDVHRWLGSQDADFKFRPQVLVMLGGSGMPSESNLIRLTYTSELAKLFPGTKIIIAHPEDSATIRQMTDFLQTFNISSERIHATTHGTNTREQVLELIQGYPGIEKEKVVVVTSPENMYRTLRTFRKAGFSTIGGVSAFENAMFTDLGYDFSKAGGKTYVPDVSSNLDIRYNFWNYLKLEITCIREFAAICYYRLNGWI